MNNIRLLLKYIAPYKWSAVKSIIYNVFAAVFTLITYTLIKPFLNVLFDFKSIVALPDPGNFQLSAAYIVKFHKNYISAAFIE